MSDSEALPRKQFRFIAEQLCLDFANTVGDHATEHPDDYFEGYPDVLVWAEQAGILTQQETAVLYRMAQANRREASLALVRARALRETIFRIFSATAAGQMPPEAELSRLNTALENASVRLHVVQQGEKFACEWEYDKTTLYGFLSPIAWSAATLLASDELHLVKQCANADCGWLFLDSTKNHSRRWCDMGDCGSRAKAKRYYQRQHSHPKS